jgi:hypothetical protein
MIAGTRRGLDRAEGDGKEKTSVDSTIARASSALPARRENAAEALYWRERARGREDRQAR